MKYYIKSSILAVLFLAVFSVGYGSTYAKTVNRGNKMTKTNKVHTFKVYQAKTVPLRCQIQSVSSILGKNLLSSYSLIKKTKAGCKGRTVNFSSGYTLIDLPDCRTFLLPPDNGGPLIA